MTATIVHFHIARIIRSDLTGGQLVLHVPMGTTLSATASSNGAFGGPVYRMGSRPRGDERGSIRCALAPGATRALKRASDVWLKGRHLLPRKQRTRKDDSVSASSHGVRRRGPREAGPLEALAVLDSGHACAPPPPRDEPPRTTLARTWVNPRTPEY